jgi:O-antigen ligase
MLLEKTKIASTLGTLLSLFSGVAVLSCYLYLQTYQPLVLLLPFGTIAFVTGLYNPLWVSYLLFGTIAISKDFQFSNKTLTLDVPDELCMLFVTVYTVFYFVLNRRTLLNNVFYDNLYSIVILLCCYMLLLICWSEQPLLSAKYFLAKIWYVMPFMFFPIIMQAHKKNWIFNMLAILVYTSGIAITIILAIHATLGFSFEKVNQACSIFFSNHVNYGTYIALLIPISIFHAKYNIYYKKFKLLNLVIVIACIIALYTSYCRSAWLAAIVSCIAILLFYTRLLFKASIIGLCIIVGIVVWLIADNNYLRFKHPFKTTEYHTEWNQHWDATFNGKDVSNAERFYRWAAGANMAYAYLPLGSGTSTFYPTYKQYRINAFKTWVSKNKERSTVHNYFLLLLIEQGIPGLMLFMAILLIYLYQIQYYKTHTLIKPWQWLSIALFTTVIMQLSSSDMLESDKAGPFFFLSLCIWYMAKNNLLPYVNSKKYYLFL